MFAVEVVKWSDGTAPPRHQEKTTKDYVSSVELGALYVRLGDKEAALESLERAYRAHDLQMQYLKVDSSFDALRSDARFKELMRKVGLPQ